MATLYVSNSTANGYAVGNDSNTYAQMQSKSTPALTLIGAVAKALSGDTIVLNDGTYSETSYVNVNVSNLTINANTDYQATVKTSDTSRVIYQNGSGTGLTLGKIVVDANNATQYCLQQANSNMNNLYIVGTHMLNFTLHGVHGLNAINVSMSGNWLIQSTNPAAIYGIYFTPPAAGTISITGGTVNLQPSSGTVAPIAIYCTTTVTGCNLVVQNNTVIYGGGSAGVKIIGIQASGFTTYDISGNTITETTLQNSSGGYEGIYIPNSSVTASKCWVYNNTINGGNSSPSTNASGHNICIGDDSDSALSYPNSINGVWVYGNTCSNMNHQILLGWITNGFVTGNKCTNGVIGVIGKQTHNCLFSGNLLIGISTGGALRAKYGNGDTYANNTVIMNTLSTSTGAGIMASNTTTGVTFINNIIYMDGVNCYFVYTSDTSTATFTSNNYYSTSGYASFVWQTSTGYTTIAQWQSAHESSALNSNPKFLNYAGNDYRTDPTGAMYHAGTYVSPKVVDFRGRPFNVKPTIGAYEHTSRDPALTRTVASERAA